VDRCDGNVRRVSNRLWRQNPGPNDCRRQGFRVWRGTEYFEGPDKFKPFSNLGFVTSRNLVQYDLRNYRKRPADTGWLAVMAIESGGR
jgi:hypothetical protein